MVPGLHLNACRDALVQVVAYLHTYSFPVLLLLAACCENVQTVVKGVTSHVCVQVACKLALRGDEPKEWWQMHCQALSANDSPLLETTHAVRGTDPQWQLAHPRQRSNAEDDALADILRLRCPGTEYVGAHPPQEHGWGPPMIVAALERVQSGTIGEAVSSVGITGLYVTLVAGLGRFVRLSIANMRMRIPYQDLPDVSHLWTPSQERSTSSCLRSSCFTL
jgi:Piezo non-specific cation channel, R-Ras-binding domain